MKYPSLIFDLDGTISDPYEGIAAGFRYALGKMRADFHPAMDFRAFIGAPLEHTFRDHFFADAMQIKEAMHHYREYYAEKGMYQNVLYTGMQALLGDLHTAGFDLKVLTNKPRSFAERIITHFGLRECFSEIQGLDLEGKIKSKTELALKMNASGSNASLLVGDTVYDISCARAAGWKVAAVTWGFGKTDELRDAGPDHLVDSVNALQSILMAQGE